jgi:hypothetical protein
MIVIMIFTTDADCEGMDLEMSNSKGENESPENSYSLTTTSSTAKRKGIRRQVYEFFNYYFGLSEDIFARICTLMNDLFDGYS